MSPYAPKPKLPSKNELAESASLNSCTTSTKDTSPEFGWNHGTEHKTVATKS